MSKPKWTPGPWVADINVPYPTIFTKGGRTRWVSLTDAGMVADDDIYDFSEDGDKMTAYNADAQLIAASPDLYAACEQMVKTMDFWRESFPAVFGEGGTCVVSPQQTTGYQMAKAALAKARGESSVPA